MELSVFDSIDAACHAAAQFSAERIREAVARRGWAVIALSGGTTPWPMLETLSAQPLPWPQVHVLQTDERVVPLKDPARNFARIAQLLPAGVKLHPMPVEEGDLAQAAARYAELMARLAGNPPVLDLVHLGLGEDGHTASLVPGDPALAVLDRDVTVTAPYRGERRMTLTLPALNRARAILWLVTGAEKAAMLARLVAGDAQIPAGRVSRERAVLFADTAAAQRT